MSEAIIVALLGAVGAILAAIIGAIATIAAARIKEKRAPHQTSKASLKVILIVMAISAFIGLAIGIFFASSLLPPKTVPPSISRTPTPIPTPTPTPSSITSSCSTNYKPIPDSFKEGLWQPSDCTCVKVNGEVIQYSLHYEKTKNESWRKENEAFAKAIQLANKDNAPEVLIYSIKGGDDSYEDIHRFKIKTGTTVYYQRFERGSQIEYGSCLTKVGEVGQRIYGSMIVERQDIYIMSRK